jgi:uncharacterized protein YfdQ (DUF2303 family)
MNENFRTENDSIIEVAQEAARAKAGAIEVLPGQMYAFPTADGYELLDLDRDEYTNRLPAPLRKTGTVVVEDVASFADYYRKHGDGSSEVYVNIDQRRITAVLDAHQLEGPRWGQHRLVLALKATEAWNAWIGNDRKEQSQQQFAEFIEDRLSDIREPVAADMLEIATTFQAKSKVNFTSALALSNGERKLVFEETTDASAGSKGNLEVPTRFKIAVKALELPVADGEDPVYYGINARFRYRIQSGQLKVLYLLEEPAAIMRDAVLAVVGQVETELGVKVLRGVPAGGH